MKNLVKIAGATSVLAMAVASAGAVAAPLTELGFSQHAGWDSDPLSWQFDPTSATNLTGLDFSNELTGPQDPADTYADMSWSDDGTTPRTSSIRVEGFDNTDSPTIVGVDLSGGAELYPADANGQWNAGEFWIITELEQTNAVLRGSVWPNPLWVADVVANLFITSADGATEYKADLDNATTIEFWETRNVAAESCNSPNPLETGCDDIYRVAAVDFDEISFNFDGFTYTIEFGLAPGPSDVDDEVSLVCNALGCSDGSTPDLGIPGEEIWIFTHENSPGTSSLFVTAAWSAREIVVPEPSMLALLGIGVLGAGFASRRRRQA